MDKKKSSEEVYAEKNMPGVAVNAADDDKVTTKLEKERTDVLGCNPRNSEGPRPVK